MEVDWTPLLDDPKMRPYALEMERMHGNDIRSWPDPGCGARFVPWRRSHGHSVVVELRANDGIWYSFLADLPPLLLWEEVYKVREAFYESLSLLTPEEIYKHIPVTIRKYDAMNPTAFPGVSYFPISLALGKAFSEEGWCVLIMSVASKDMERLDRLFTMCKKYCDEKFPSKAYVEE